MSASESEVRAAVASPAAAELLAHVSTAPVVAEPVAHASEPASLSVASPPAAVSDVQQSDAVQDQCKDAASPDASSSAAQATSSAAFVTAASAASASSAVSVAALEAQWHVEQLQWQPQAASMSLSPAARLRTHVLHSICAFEWSRKRDLPPILSKPVVRASPAVFLLQAHLAGAIRDLYASAAPADARTESLQLLLHACVGATESYLSLSVSRFHSRQLFVDLASLLLVGRSFVQAFTNVPVAVNAAAAEREASLLHETDVVLLELACAVLVTHPSLLALDTLPAILQTWEQHWSTNKSTTSAGSIDCTPFAQQLPSLWCCEPAVLPNAAAAAASAPSALVAFFALPNARGAAATNGWLAQSMELPGCDASSLLQSPMVLAHVTAPRLLRLIALRPQLRIDDFPELSAEEEQQAASIRSTLTGLEASFGS